MNEAKLQILLKSIYNVCQNTENYIETLKEVDEVFDLYDEIEYFEEIYDKLFDLTTEIEIRYGLI